jgi:hypothetical protein
MTEPEERAARIRRSVEEGKCAWCAGPISDWPERKGLGDDNRGRFCSVACLGDMYGPEFLERHKDILETREN